MNTTDTIVKNYIRLKEQLEPLNIHIIVVTKNQLPENILPLYEHGHRDFGENRVQEWKNKKDTLPEDIRWHMIGHLQTNKVKYLLNHIHMIQSVDRPELMQEIQKRAHKLNITVNCLLQVKIAREETKYGMLPDTAYNWFINKEWLNYPNLRFLGLMGIATFTTNKKQIRSEFRTLFQLFQTIKNELPAHPTAPSLKYLSMGMSNDWQIAIEEGANMIRIGQAIFGPRPR